MGILSRNPLAAASSVPPPAPLSSISLPPPAILGFLLTPGTLTGARQWRRRCRRGVCRGRRVCGLSDTAEQSRELLRDSPLYLLQQTASGPAAVVGELLEAGNRVHAKEVLVGLLVGQVELAHIGFGQNGFEDVVLVRVVDDVLEHLVGVAKPAQLVIVGLEVAVHQQGVDAHTDAMLADESDLVLYLILNHLQGRGERIRGDGGREREKQTEGRKNLERIKCLHCTDNATIIRDLATIFTSSATHKDKSQGTCVLQGFSEF